MKTTGTLFFDWGFWQLGFLNTGSSAETLKGPVERQSGVTYQIYNQFVQPHRAPFLVARPCCSGGSCTPILLCRLATKVIQLLGDFSRRRVLGSPRLLREVGRLGDTGRRGD